MKNSYTFYNWLFGSLVLTVLLWVAISFVASMSDPPKTLYPEHAIISLTACQAVGSEPQSYTATYDNSKQLTVVNSICKNGISIIVDVPYSKVTPKGA